MALNDYRKKRNFAKTPEPKGDEPRRQKSAALRFVIQLHDATRRHYDLRLELDGTMKSWAVPKGPSLDPIERRLAVAVEDHPLAYNDFEGIIPKGNYGAGNVMIWDEGTYTARAVDFPAKDEADALRRGLAKGHLTFVVDGVKLKGEFALLRLAKGGPNTWLLVKKHDQYASREEITHSDRSARTDRTMGEIAASAEGEGKVWHSKPAANSIHASATPKTKKTPLGKAKASTKERLTAASKSPLKPKSRALQRSPGRAPLPAAYRKIGAPADKVFAGKIALWLPQSTPPAKANLLLHPVYDGYRAQLTIDALGHVLLTGRGHIPLTKRFPVLAADLSHVPGPLQLDGLVVPLGPDGEPRRRGRSTATAAPTYAFFAYDLLSVDGYDFTAAPLTKRLATLATLSFNSTHLRVVDPWVNGAPLLESVQTCLARALDEGYDGATKPRVFSPSARRAQSAGDSESESAQATVLPPRAPGSRHTVVNQVAAVSTPQLSLSNLTKIYWPKDRITKGDLLDYYRAIAPLMLPYLKDRPQSLNRHPNGIDAASFFQKEVAGHVPRWMQLATIASGRSGKSVTYALCQSTTDLLCLANMGCIEINTWLSRVNSINSPDYLVVDLDPGKIAFDSVVEVARACKKLFDEIDVPSFCKTSGSRGLHIYVPISGAENYDRCRTAAELIARELHRRLPATTSLERSPARRTELIYLDYLQNRIGQTMASVYSVRPRPGATVSTPLRWSEVKRGLDPTVFTMASVLRRVDRLGDLWGGLEASRVPLSGLQKALDKLLTKSAKPPKS